MDHKAGIWSLPDLDNQNSFPDQTRYLLVKSSYFFLLILSYFLEDRIMPLFYSDAFKVIAWGRNRITNMGTSQLSVTVQ